MSELDVTPCIKCATPTIPSEFARTGYKGTRRNLCKICRNTYAREWSRNQRESTASRASKLVASAKRRAELKSIPFDLTVEWLLSRLDLGVCEATGISFSMSAKRNWNTPSLDRRIPAEGYTKQNTRVVLFALNVACGNWGEHRLIDIVAALNAKVVSK